MVKGPPPNMALIHSGSVALSGACVVMMAEAVEVSATVVVLARVVVRGVVSAVVCSVVPSVSLGVDAHAEKTRTKMRRKESIVIRESECFILIDTNPFIIVEKNAPFVWAKGAFVYNDYRAPTIAAVSCAITSSSLVGMR